MNCLLQVHVLFPGLPADLSLWKSIERRCAGAHQSPWLHAPACHVCVTAQSDPFAMGGLLGALLGQGLQMSGGEQYGNQTPVLSSNNMFDINRRLCI